MPGEKRSNSHSHLFAFAIHFLLSIEQTLKNACHKTVPMVILSIFIYSDLHVSKQVTDFATF